MTDSKKRSNWPSIVLFICIIGLATYVMMQNPDHKVSFGTYGSGDENGYDSIEIVQDTVAVVPAAGSGSAQRTKRQAPLAPERDLLSEEIPTELPR